MPKVLVYVDDSPDDLFLFRSACKLAKAAYYVLRDEVEFNEQKMFG